MIPHRIHQSWKNHQVPEKWLPLQNSWRRLHPEFSYHFWTDNDNREFIKVHYPEYLTVYENYPLAIQKAELARYLVIFHFGGVYVDMDFEALRPIADLLAEFELAFGLEPASHANRPAIKRRGLERVVCNAFMASIPRHPFWQHLFRYLLQTQHELNVLDSTGTFVLTRACNSYPQISDIRFIPSEKLYPVDNEEILSLDERAIRQKAKDAYALHYWAGSWWRESVLVRAQRRIASAREKSS